MSTKKKRLLRLGLVALGGCLTAVASYLQSNPVFSSTSTVIIVMGLRLLDKIVEAR